MITMIGPSPQWLKCWEKEDSCRVARVRVVKNFARCDDGGVLLKKKSVADNVAKTALGKAQMKTANSQQFDECLEPQLMSF